MCSRLTAIIDRQKDKFLSNAGRRLYQVFSPAGAASEATPSGLAAVLTAGLIFVVMLIAYIAG